MSTQMHLNLRKPEDFIDVMKKQKQRAMPGDPEFFSIIARNKHSYVVVYTTKIKNGTVRLAMPLSPDNFGPVGFVRTEAGKYVGIIHGLPEHALHQAYFEDDWQEKLDERLPQLHESWRVEAQERKIDGSVKTTAQTDYQVFRCPLTTNYELMEEECEEDAIDARRQMKIELVVRPLIPSQPTMRSPAPWSPPPPFAPPPYQVPLATAPTKYPHLVFTLEVEHETKVDLKQLEATLRKMEFDIYDGQVTAQDE